MKKLMVLSLILLLLAACSSAEQPPTPIPTNTAAPPPTNTYTPIPPTETPIPTATVTPTYTATPTEIPVFWDDFNSEFLPGWSWIRENDTLWSLDAEPGFLRIVLTADNPPRNLLVRDIKYQNFQIMTHVRFKPTSNFQFAGLLVYLDDKTMLGFGRAFCNLPNTCVGNGIYFDAVQNGKTVGGNFSTATPIQDEAYLRMDKNGTKFTGYYSDNGTDWIMIGEHELSMIDPKVGLIATNSHIVGMTAYFDYFTLVDIP
jgi:beta-xylosidase